jgi:hypothetical protein
MGDSRESAHNFLIFHPADWIVLSRLGPPLRSRTAQSPYADDHSALPRPSITVQTEEDVGIYREDPARLKFKRVK